MFAKDKKLLSKIPHKLFMYGILQKRGGLVLVADGADGKPKITLCILGGTIYIVNYIKYSRINVFSESPIICITESESVCTRNV